MLRKTLIAMAVAGSLGCSAGAFAGSGTAHTTYKDDSGPMAMDETRSSLQMDTSLNSAQVAPVPSEIRDGVIASLADEEFDGQLLADHDTAVGATSSAGGSGAVGFATHRRVITSDAADNSDASVAVDEVYLVPAPLAHNPEMRYWKLEVSPSNLQELERHYTENVYVITPIAEAIVHPHVALTSDEGSAAPSDTHGAAENAT